MCDCTMRNCGGHAACGCSCHQAERFLESWLDALRPVDNDNGSDNA